MGESKRESRYLGASVVVRGVGAAGGGGGRWRRLVLAGAVAAGTRVVEGDCRFTTA